MPAISFGPAIYSHFCISTHTPLARLRPFFRNGCKSSRRNMSCHSTADFISLNPHSQASCSANETDYYGPSMDRGSKLKPGLVALQPIADNPNLEHNGHKNFFLDEDAFTRVYDIAALRVPVDDCASLVFSLKGHLLNWPRIKNVARVPGDDVCKTLQPLFWEKEGKVKNVVNSVKKAVYGEGGEKKLKFENLDRLSKPNKSVLGVLREGKTDVKGRSAESHDDTGMGVIVQVVGEDDELRVENWKSLLKGDDVKWEGPTRLLLLDDKHAGKSVSELPMAVQVALSNKDGTGRRELVQCKLILSYAYWPMDEILKELLPSGMTVPSAFETVGHIAHLNLRNEHLPFRHAIGKVVLDKHKPKIKSVVNKIECIHNQYRSMELEVLAGNHSLVTTVTENGLTFHVDLARVYWNSKLATERERLVSSFTDRDIICDVFAGVGPITVASAKKSKKVYANDLNPDAVKYLAKNISHNKVSGKVKVFNMDGRTFIRDLFASNVPVYVSQVIMNLPSDALEFLDSFKGIFKRETWTDRPLPRIHIYGFSKHHNPLDDFKQRIEHIIGEDNKIEVRPVRLVAPRKWMLLASFRIPCTYAFNKA